MLLWRDLTKVIFILNQRSQDWQVPARNQTWASTAGGEHSRKVPFNQFVNSYSEHLHMSAQPVENAYSMAPPRACVTWTYMNTHELHKDVGRIAIARHQLSICQLPRHQHLQVRAFTVKQDRSHRGHHYEETWPRSSSSKTRGPRTDMSRSEASTPEKSHSNSLLIAIWNIYIWARKQWRMLATVQYINSKSSTVGKS